MKKVFAFSIAIIMALSFVACTADNGVISSPEIEYVDESFILSLGDALEKRFDAADKLDTEKDALSNVEYYEKLSGVIDIEKHALADYRTGTFQDPKLQEYAISYINILEESQSVLADVEFDYLTATDAYDKAYNNRLKLLSIFVSDYGLTVDETHYDTLNSMMKKAQNVIKNESAKEAVKSILSNLVFEEVENSYGWKTYRAILDNTSEYGIQYISYTIDLMDADGIVIEQAYAGVNNVSPGKKYNVEFSTDKDFASYDYVYTYTLA